jgi:magnesium chelatase subunit D
MTDGLLTLISQLCTDLNIVSLRADIVLYKTALTIAALAERTDVTPDDVKQAAELALPHRQRKRTTDAPPLAASPPTPPKPPKETETGQDNLTMDSTPGDSPKEDTEPTPEPTQPERIFGALPLIDAPTLPTVLTEQLRQSQPAPKGQHQATTGHQRGTFVRAVPNPQPTDLAVTATLQSALLRDTGDLIISRNDLHQTVRASKTSRLILFVVDASGSMAAGQRMEAVKGTVLSLLTDAYQHRDSVGVISFRGVDAQLLLPPTRNVEQAEQALRTLPTGGRTPLPHALQLALDVIQQYREHRPLLIILSDGKANVSLPGGGDAWQQVMQLAGQVRAQSTPALVLDTDADYLRLGRANALADALGADCISLDNLSADVLTETVSSRVFTT